MTTNEDIRNQVLYSLRKAGPGVMVPVYEVVMMYGHDATKAVLFSMRRADELRLIAIADPHQYRTKFGQYALDRLIQGENERFGYMEQM